MKKLAYLTKLGQQMGFSVLPNARPFNDFYLRGKGVVLGTQAGYLVAAGLINSGRNNAMGIMVRYRKGSPAEAIKTTLQSLATFKGLMGRKNLKVAEEGLVVTWLYSFKKPSAESVIAVVDDVVANIHGLALPFSGKCEDCNSSDANEITLVSGVPGYHCLGCQSRLTAEKERVAEEYKDRPANYLLGVPAGILAAAAGGTAWGLLISAMEAGSKSWTPKLHAVAGLFIGGLVAWILFKTVGKVTHVGQGIAILLTLAGKFWGDALFYTFDALYDRGEHMSLNFLSWSQAELEMFKGFLNLVLHNFWTVKIYGFDGKFVLLADVACAVGILWMPWGKIPKFIPTFENVGKVPERTSQKPVLST